MPTIHRNRLRKRSRRSKCASIVDGAIKLGSKGYVKLFLILALLYYFAYTPYLKKTNSDEIVTKSNTQRHDRENTLRKHKVQPQEQLHPKPMMDNNKNMILPSESLMGNSERMILPSKPLRPLNLEIISRTRSVDLTYIDVSDDGSDHPHLGGSDEDGKFGYVFDETALRKNPPKFERIDEEEGDACEVNKDGNYHMLTQRVSIDFAGHEAAEAKAKMNNSPERAKIMCIVYTIEAHHSRIPSIQQTWGQHCDGFIVISDKTDPILGTVNVPHEGEEEYGNIWQKIRSAWSYIYDNYYDMYDWFHIGGDDLYILVENLRLYLESEEIRLAENGGKVLPNSSSTSQYPLFLGRRFKEQGNEHRIFNSGGSGYTLNKAALKLLVAEGMPKCMPHAKTFAEDVMVAQCLRNQFKVFPYDTKDEDGGERYMPFQPAHHFSYRIPKGPTDDWYVKYSIDIKEGLDHCAKHSVAFHYVKPKLMKRMHAILYGLCPSSK